MIRYFEWTLVLLVAVFCLGTESTIGNVSAAQPDAPVEMIDDFDGSLGLQWEPRNPDASHVSLDKRPGTLTITTQQGGFFQENTSYKNLMLVKNPVEEDGDFELTTCLVSFAPFANVQQAGLVCFNDEDNYIKWVSEWHDVHGGRVFSLVREMAGRPAVNPCGYAMSQGGRIWLRLTKRGNRYEYASSSDGESFHAFGETMWDRQSPEWLGLVAKNSAGAAAPKLHASFDFFRIRPMPAEEPPVDPEIVPEGGPDELLEYIKALKEHRPGATQAMLAAAQRILQQRPADDTAESLRTALLLVLEDRIRTLHRVDVQRQQETVQYLKMLIEAIAEERAIELAMSAAQALERAGQDELAAEACRDFAKLIARHEDKELARMAERFQAVARRVKLAGYKLDLAGTTVDGADLDWDGYQDKVVLICFWPVPSRLHHAEMAAIKDLYDVYHDLGFEVVAISSDENRGDLREFLKEQQIPWVTLHDGDAKGTHPMAARLGIEDVPRALLIDRAGAVVSMNARGGQRAELLKELLGPSYQHGATLAVAGRWDQLAADFEKVVVIEPENGGAWQSLAVACLQDEDMEGYRKACRRAFEQLSDTHIWAQATLVQLCSLAPEPGVDRKRLTQTADEALREDDNTTMKLAKGMDHYRCGRFEEALNILPASGDSNQVPTSLLFQAMAHKRLGREEDAQRLLQQGIREMEGRIPTIEGPPLADYMPARWVVWATHRILRQEAEEVVRGQAD